MSVLDKLKKSSTIKESSILSKSKFFTEKEMEEFFKKLKEEDNK